MVGHVLPNAAKLNVCARAVRADSAKAAPGSTAAPLSAEEAELAARMDVLLRRKPRKQSARNEAAETADTSDVTVIPHIDRDPFDRTAPPLALPAFEDDPEPGAGEKTVRTIIWLHRSRRTGFKRRLRSSVAWLVTFAVILATVGAATLSLIGMEKSIALARAARGHAIATLAVIETQISTLRKL